MAGFSYILSKALCYENKLTKRDFVKIGNDIEVIVFITREKDILIEHIGVWFGETNEQGNPKYRTVLMDYCKK